MRLLKFLYNVHESAVSDAIKIEEPDETKEYDKTEIKKNINVLSSALSALKSKSDKNDLDKSSIADFAKSLRGWISLLQDRFGDDSGAGKIAGKAPTKITAPIDPQGTMDPKLAIKLAGVEDDDDEEPATKKKKSKKDK